MNIVLVNPPFTYFPGSPAARYNYCRPPLGLCYLASHLKEYGGADHAVTIVDMLAEHRTEDQWIRHVASLSPDLVGFSVVTPTANTARRMARGIRALRPGVRLAAGGPHATVRPQDLTGDFDAVAAGEGEATFLELVSRLADNAPFHDVPGIICERDGAPHAAPARELIRPLDRIPPPDRTLLNLPAYYHSLPYGRGLFSTLFTARGCPNNCYFCANKALWNRSLRYHSLDYVARELDLLVNRLHITQIFIDDDDFLANKKRALQICEHIIATGLRFKWICHCCAASIDSQSLKIMKRAGCAEIQIGVESGDAAILEQIPKCASPDRIAETFKTVHAHGINTWATFILGHPGDTHESIRNTIRFARRIDPAYASFILLLPFPGSAAFEDYQARGWLKTTNWDHYSWHGAPVFETPQLSAADLVQLRARAMRSFYLRPRKIARYVWQMLKTRSARELVRDFFSWFSLAWPNHRIKQH